MKLYGKTDIGSRRMDNQDIFSIGDLQDDASFAVLCDGMGGENGGQIASAVATQVIEEYLKTHFHADMTDDECRNLVLSAVSEGNYAVFQKASEVTAYHGMGTTCILTLLYQNKAHIAHVGDSRVYLLRGEEFVQVTTDHSLVQMLMDSGEITAEEALVHPRRNMITRSVGVGETVDIDYLEIGNMTDTSLLLCSDGLTNCCTDATISSLILQTPPQQVCDALIDAANEGGGIDNITAVFVTGQEER